MAVKRKNYLMKIHEKENENPSKSSSEGPPKDTLATFSAEEEQIDEPEIVNVEANEHHVRADKGKLETSSKPIQPVLEPANEEQPATSGKFSSETNTEGEDGWLPVQRPRSAGGSGRRVKQRRATVGKLYGYQKKEGFVESDHAKLNNSSQSTGYYVLRKRQLAGVSYTDQHTVKSASQVSKFGRRVVKSVTYRVKSVPSSVKSESKDVASRESESVQSQGKISIVRLGKSPSYKDVALAPPGSIAKLQVNHDVQIGSDIGAEKCEDTVASEVRENVASKVTELKVNNAKEINECSPSVTNNPSSVEQGIEENKYNGVARNSDTSVMVPTTVDRAECDTIDIHEVVVPQSKPITTGETSSIISSTDLNFEKDVAHSSEPENNAIVLHSQGEENLEDKPMVTNSSDARDFTSKKLSASAAPFKPSPAIPRAAPRPLSLNPSGPGAIRAIGPWPVNMTLHHGPATLISSPHHAYPSPPATPNIIQPVPFIYPPFSQAQPIPPNSFPPSGNHFHRGHYAWQCINPNPPEFISGPAWPGCRPVEFSVGPPVAEPISEPILESKAQSPSSESSPNLAPLLPDDISSGAEARKEEVLPVPEGVENAERLSWIELESEKQKCTPDSCEESKGTLPLYDDKPKEKSGENLEDEERTFSILVRGKRNRKHTLRVPISLLRRPHCSQSFKVAYSRVVRDSETPKSVAPLSSGESNGQHE